MTKIKTSISIEMAAYDNLQAISNRYFNGNVSKVIEWFARSKQSRKEFFRFMAKHHAQQLFLYQEHIRLIEKEDQAQREISDADPIQN